MGLVKKFLAKQTKLAKQTNPENKRLAHTDEGLQCAELARWIEDEGSRPNKRWGPKVGTNWESLLCYSQTISKIARDKIDGRPFTVSWVEECVKYKNRAKETA